MRLVKAQVSRFKSITETSDFTVDEKVTALVGKNESGKTAVLQAMYRLKPLPAGHPVGFEDLRDYPRRYRSRDKVSIPTTEPVALTFELAVMAARLPQTLAQLDVVFAGWVEAGHVRVDDGEFLGDPPAAAAVVSTYLTDAAAAAQRLAQMLDLTHEALAGAAWQDTPTG